MKCLFWIYFKFEHSDFHLFQPSNLTSKNDKLVKYRVGHSTFQFRSSNAVMITTTLHSLPPQEPFAQKSEKKNQVPHEMLLIKMTSGSCDSKVYFTGTEGDLKDQSSLSL